MAVNEGRELDENTICVMTVMMSVGDEDLGIKTKPVSLICIRD